MRTNIFRHGKAALASAFAVGLIVASTPLAQSTEETAEGAVTTEQSEGSQLAAADVTAGETASAETVSAPKSADSSPAPESAPAPKSSPADAGERSAAVGPGADFKVKTVKVDGDVATVELSGTITDDSGLNKPLESLMLHNRSTKATVSQVVSAALDDKAGYGELFSFEPKELKDTFGMSDEDAKFPQILRVSLNSEDFGHDQTESLVGKKFSVTYKVPAEDKDAQWALLPNDAASLPDIDFGSQGFAVAGNSPHSREDGLWVIGSGGGVEKIKYQNGRYVSAESRDIPFATRSCGSAHQLINPTSDTGIFDGLAVSADGNTMYAIQSYSNATRAQEVDDKTGGVSVYRYTNGQWNTWNLRNGGRTIAKQPVRWNGCSGGQQTANYSPSITTSDSGMSNRDYTFGKARTNFTSGTIIDAGTSNEALIFGGPDSTRFVGSGGQNTLKLFSFQPGTTGAVVKYLGWIPVPHLGPQSVFGGFTSDADGNVYAAVGDPYDGALNVKIYKFTKDQIRGKINSPAKQFSNKGRYGWGDDSWDQWGFGNKNCGAIGGRTSSNSCAPMLTDSAPDPYTAFNVPLPAGYSLDGFSGFSISPDGNYTIGTKISRGASHTGTFGYVVEVDDDGQLVEGIRPYSVLATNGNGQGRHVHEHTDISGALHSSTPQPPNPGPGPGPTPPPPPAPNRTFTLYKSLTRAKGTDQFDIGMNGRSNNISTVTYHGTESLKTDGVIQIGDTQSVGAGDLHVTFSEKALAGARLSDYDTSVACSADDVVIPNLRLESPVVSGLTWDQRATIPANNVGNIKCVISNEAQRTPTKNIVLYKYYNRLINPQDSFNLRMSTTADGITDSNTVIPAPDSRPFHLNFAGRLLNVPVGSRVRVQETAANGDLNLYEKSVSCDVDGNTFVVSQGNTGTLDFNVPSSQFDTISCIVSNQAPREEQPVQKRHVKLYKKFDELDKPSDVFEIGAYWNLTEYGDSIKNTAGKSKGNYNLITEADIPVGAKFRIYESAGNNTTDLTKYDSTLECFNGDYNEPPTSQSKRVAVPGGGIDATFKPDQVPENANSLSCFFTNTLKNHRTLTLHKKFEGTSDTTGFTLQAYHGNNVDVSFADNTVNNGIVKTGVYPYYGTTFQIGQRIDFPAAPMRYSLREVPDSDVNFGDFEVSFECTDEAVPVNKYTDQGTKSADQWFANGYVPANMVGDVSCNIVNKKKKKTYNVTLFKDADLFSNNDHFNVDLKTPNTNGPGQLQYDSRLSKDTSDWGLEKNTVAEGTKSYTRYKIGTVTDVGTQRFRIGESASAGTLDKYSTSVECKLAATDSVISSHAEVYEDQGYRYADIRVPADTQGDVNCYLRNDKHAKIFIRHVLNGRYRDNGPTDQDQFEVEAHGGSFASTTRTTTNQDTLPGPFTVVDGEPLKLGDKVHIGERVIGPTLESNYISNITCEDQKDAAHLDVPGRVVVDAPGRVVANPPGINWDITWTSFEGDVLCTVTNTPKAQGVIVITKVAAGTNYKLPGSQWKLLREDRPNHWVEAVRMISDNNGAPGADAEDGDKESGVIRVEGLPWGTYKVIETVAPLGYSLPKDGDSAEFKPAAITIEENVPIWPVTVQNKREPIGEMPLTGGVGFAPYFLSGLALVMLAFGSHAYGGRGGRKRMAA